jgi:hypothetical protein
VRQQQTPLAEISPLPLLAPGKTRRQLKRSGQSN